MAGFCPHVLLHIAALELMYLSIVMMPMYKGFRNETDSADAMIPTWSVEFKVFSMIIVEVGIAASSVPNSWSFPDTKSHKR